jgi:hypothetical protein
MTKPNFLKVGLTLTNPSKNDDDEFIPHPLNLRTVQKLNIDAVPTRETHKLIIQNPPVVSQTEPDCYLYSYKFYMYLAEYGYYQEINAFLQTPEIPMRADAETLLEAILDAEFDNFSVDMEELSPAFTPRISWYNPKVELFAYDADGVLLDLELVDLKSSEDIAKLEYELVFDIYHYDNIEFLSYEPAVTRNDQCTETSSPTFDHEKGDPFTIRLSNYLGFKITVGDVVYESGSIWITSSAESVLYELEENNPELKGKVKIEKDPIPHSYDRDTFYFEFVGFDEDIPELTFDEEKHTVDYGGSLNKIEEVTILQHYDIEKIGFQEIPFEFINTIHTVPQITVTNKGSLAGSLTAGYEYITFTSEITDFSLSGTEITITGVSLAEADLELDYIKIGESDCTISSRSETEIICSYTTAIAGDFKPTIHTETGNLDYNTDPSDKTLEIPLSISSVTPNTDVSPSGGNELTIAGEGFVPSLGIAQEKGYELIVTINEEDVFVKSTTEDTIVVVTNVMEDTTTYTLKVIVNAKEDTASITTGVYSGPSVHAIVPVFCCC